MEISKVGQAAYSIPNQTADWLVNVTLGVRSILASPNTSVSINIPELNLSSGLLPVQSIPANTDESTFVTVAMTVPEGVPRRWWPTDLGSPKLYNFTIALTLGDANATLDKVSFTMRSGFRTIELLQTAYTDEEVATRGITPGDKWHFAVNGQDFYTKGTSVVPFDSFYARISQDKVRWILESAVQSGQNMVSSLLFHVFALTHCFVADSRFASGEVESTSHLTHSPEVTTSIRFVMNSESSRGRS